MTTAAYPGTVKDALVCIRSADASLDTAIALLSRAADADDRPLVTGYAGATAIKHLREARKYVEKARTQIDSLRRA
jgi:hypothetical protein